MINHYNRYLMNFFFLELDLSKHINIYALFVLSLVESRCQSIGYKTIHWQQYTEIG